MEKKNNQFQQIDELLIKYLTGSADKEEREAARAWINEDPEHGEYFDELKNIYQLTGVIRQPSGFDVKEGWNRVKARYYKLRFEDEMQKKRTYQRKIILGVTVSSVAAMLVAFLIGWNGRFLFFGQKSQATAYNEIMVPLGAKSQVTLSDGTKVWLNAGSKLRYPLNFMARKREVYLEGEAYFDVTKNKHKQFVVKTSNIDIKVYGTKFNVKSYPDENLIQTTLVEGSVAIETNMKNAKNKTIYLKPNQTATFYKSVPAENAANKTVTGNSSGGSNAPQKSIEISRKIDPLPVTSWKDPEWVIVGEDLGDLAVKLERRYNVKITFKDESLKKYKFSGTLEDETFEQVLKIMQLSAPILYTIDGNNVVFRADPTYQKKYDKMISNKDK